MRLVSTLVSACLVFGASAQLNYYQKDDDVRHYQKDDVQWKGFSDDSMEALRKAVGDFYSKDQPPALSRELAWVVKQCQGEFCYNLKEYLIDLPHKTKSMLSEALSKAGVGSRMGELALRSSEKRAAELVGLVEGILQANKVDEFQQDLSEALASAFDHETVMLQVGKQKVQVERIGSSIYLEHDIYVAEVPDDLGSVKTFSALSWPVWMTEEIMKAIQRLLQGNINYWPVSYDFADMKRIVQVPFKINHDLSADKEEDVAEALARMCLETAVPLPEWMEGESFARDLITALTAHALHEGTSTCATLINHINDVLGTNMGTTFLLNLIPRTTQVSYIHFKYHASRCSSPVGMKIGEPNNVNVADWCGVGSLMHETLHSLGFYHQQSRNNRDSYVDVLWENIQDDKEHNYEKKSFLTGGTNYDYFSILHYSRINGFSIGGAPTMDATPPLGAMTPAMYAVMVAFYNGAMGQREGLSTTDLQALQNVY